MLILGLDVSTSCTGYCILEKVDKSISLVEAGSIDLKKIKNFFDKSLKIKSFLEQINNRFFIELIAVEENLQSFRPGMSSAKTLLSLAKFNGVTCFLSEEIFSISPTMLSVVRARSQLGIKINRKSSMNTKEQVLEWAKLQNCFSGYKWPKKKLKRGPREGLIIDDPACFDIADAAVICLFAAHLNN